MAAKTSWNQWNLNEKVVNKGMMMINKMYSKFWLLRHCVRVHIFWFSSRRGGDNKCAMRYNHGVPIKKDKYVGCFNTQTKQKMATFKGKKGRKGRNQKSIHRIWLEFLHRSLLQSFSCYTLCCTPCFQWWFYLWAVKMFCWSYPVHIHHNVLSKLSLMGLGRYGSSCRIDYVRARSLSGGLLKALIVHFKFILNRSLSFLLPKIPLPITCPSLKIIQFSAISSNSKEKT